MQMWNLWIIFLSCLLLYSIIPGRHGQVSYIFNTKDAAYWIHITLATYIFLKKLFLVYRHALFYHILLYSVLLCFLQIKGLWPPYTEKIYWCHFSSVYSFYVFVLRFVNSLNISGSPPAKRLQFAEGSNAG